MTTVHRLLDEAFAGARLTPEVADLKEEIRAGLLDRAGELEASGLPPDDAARRAVAELGDIGELIAEVTGDAPSASAAAPGRRATAEDPPAATRRPAGRHPAWSEETRLHSLHRVRPDPSFVVAVTLAAVVAAGAVIVLTLMLVGVLGTTGHPAAFGLCGVAAVATGWIVGSSLRQETTTNHPVPARRATGYGVAALVAVLGAGVLGTSLLDGDHTTGFGWQCGGAVLVLIAALAFTWLGITQTNRKKAWARDAARAQNAANRFLQDPAAAARFGLYTVVIWMVAFIVAVVIGVAWTWVWSWLPLVVAAVVMLLLLAQMLFGDNTKGDKQN